MTTHHLSQLEEEYFAKEEIAKIKKLSAQKQALLKQEEEARLKALHWMRCAKCGHELHPVVFKGITIDKCFGCGGVFLDDGELEKDAGQESGFLSGVLGLFKS